MNKKIIISLTLKICTLFVFYTWIFLKKTLVAGLGYERLKGVNLAMLSFKVALLSVYSLSQLMLILSNLRLLRPKCDDWVRSVECLSLPFIIRLTPLRCPRRTSKTSSTITLSSMVTGAKAGQSRDSPLPLPAEKSD